MSYNRTQVVLCRIAEKITADAVDTSEESSMQHAAVIIRDLQGWRMQGDFGDNPIEITKYAIELVKKDAYFVESLERTTYGDVVNVLREYHDALHEPTSPSAPQMTFTWRERLFGSRTKVSMK